VAASREMAGGRLRVDWQSNWLLDFRLHDTGVAGFTEYAGTFPGLAGVGSFSRVRSRIVAGWERGPYVFEWTGRYISGARVLGAGAADLFIKAPGIFYQSVSLTRRFGRITAMAGIDNLADTRPPTLVDGETNTSTSTYDVVGRFVWGRLSYSF